MKNHSKDQKKVSIILPSYNGEKYLSQSIDSCLAQTYKHIELILINDASTDNTAEIMRHYYTADPRIIFINNQHNKKLPTSLNIGHKVSSGEYITWTSDDNLYRGDAIEKMVGLLDANQSLGMVYCDEWLIDEKGDLLEKISVGPNESIIRRNCIGACFLYRRSVYLTIGEYSRGALYAEDYDYWMRIATKFMMEPLHEDLYYYRIHNKSLSSTINLRSRKKVDERIVIRNLLKINWLSTGDRYDVAKRIMRRSYSRKDILNLVASFWLATLINPSKLFYDGSSWIKRNITKLWI
jgi:glycosyltransferase involved in cell wall biosynthesis